MTFNPFEKPVDDLGDIDLQRVIDRDVAEGLYMEYKREFPKNEKIGWSLASFANSYGGWYVVGVEADKQRNTAVKLTGIDLTSERDPISKVREIAKSQSTHSRVESETCTAISGTRCVSRGNT